MCKKKRGHLFHLVIFDASTSYAPGGTIEKLSCRYIESTDFPKELADNIEAVYSKRF
jgi:hypothetical protein